MKKLSILFVCVLALGMSFVSCSKDDAKKEASVEGKWNFESAALVKDKVEAPYNDFLDNQAGCTKNYLEFKTAGVVSSGKYSSGCKLTVETGSWSKKDNTLTITSNGIAIPYEVVSVTDSAMRLKITYNEGGIKLDVIVTFVRV
jgi:hypothetical protein